MKYYQCSLYRIEPEECQECLSVQPIFAENVAQCVVLWRASVDHALLALTESYGFELRLRVLSNLPTKNERTKP